MIQLAVLQIYMSPFTKVEESFNVQAMHDMIFERQNLDRYDHFQFPGVVPRTFIGAFINAILASPICLLFESIYAPRVISLFVCRMVLAALSVYSLATFRFQVEKKFGKIVSACFAVVCSIQFHLLFYCSRPLPNTYASIFVNLAFASWLKEQYEVLFSILAFAAIVFRSELVVLAAPIFVSLVVLRSYLPLSSPSLTRALLQEIFKSLCRHQVLQFDSLLWRRWLWPEGEVFYFNTILNKSSQWGVMPWHWYFSSALPRSMMGTLFLLPGGLIYTERMRPFFFPVLAFICLYSFLPHKELRFIIYALPIFNCVVAMELARLYLNRNKESMMDKLRSPKFFFRAAVTMIVLNVSATFGFTRVASKNYPGGDALILLHEMERQNVTSGLRPFVHIDVPAAQQGISRFLEMSSPWRKGG
uniref:Mannosyltransferase n=1 Tax=Guillardia theta (strain CCMP2712) TaxID=905079 RepID=A0A0C3U7G3_GUITC